MSIDDVPIPTSFRSMDYDRAEVVNDAGTIQLLHFSDGEVRVWHTCVRPDKGTIICAPRLQLDTGGHRLTEADGRSTVEPSILCPDCGLHGFVRDGLWVAA